MGSEYARTTIGGVRVYVHRYLMEQELGRSLRHDEHVHHRNGNRRDNRLANLEVLSARDHGLAHGGSWLTSRWTDPTCRGCSCHHDERTRGCDSCRMRHNRRIAKGVYGVPAHGKAA